MATKTKRQVAVPKRPERKWGPFHGGVGVAVWLNEVETADGRKWFRSVTIAPRRYLKAETGQWEDATSYRTVDLPSLILALQAALEFVSSTPLPGQPVDEEVQPELAAPSANGEERF
jgi:hypothetical protein